ncbi:MAG: iron-sulfur cluster insertion protein ErpA, partial [Gammaproteobacteria bacterium]
MDTEVANSPLIFTSAAARKVRQLIEEESNPALKLRVFVTG